MLVCALLSAAAASSMTVRRDGVESTALQVESPDHAAEQVKQPHELCNLCIGYIGPEQNVYELEIDLTPCCVNVGETVHIPEKLLGQTPWHPVQFSEKMLPDMYHASLYVKEIGLEASIEYSTLIHMKPQHGDLCLQNNYATCQAEGLKVYSKGDWRDDGPKGWLWRMMQNDHAQLPQAEQTLSEPARREEAPARRDEALGEGVTEEALLQGQEGRVRRERLGEHVREQPAQPAPQQCDLCVGGLDLCDDPYDLECDEFAYCCVNFGDDMTVKATGKQIKFLPQYMEEVAKGVNVADWVTVLEYGVFGIVPAKGGGPVGLPGRDEKIAAGNDVCAYAPKCASYGKVTATASDRRQGSHEKATTAFFLNEQCKCRWVEGVNPPCAAAAADHKDCERFCPKRVRGRAPVEADCVEA